MAKKPKTQADQRRDFNVVDQFGRRWLMTIELATGDPTGSIDQAGWPHSDPLRTPMKYLTVPRTEFGQPAVGRIETRFDLWFTDIRQAEREWRDDLRRVSRIVYKKIEPKDVRELECDEYIVELAGPKPWPSSEILTAAASGQHPDLLGLAPLTERHKQMLGIEDEGEAPARPAGKDDGNTRMGTGTEDAAGAPPDNYHQFVQWAMHTQEMDFEQARAAWREHKAELQEA